MMGGEKSVVQNLDTGNGNGIMAGESDIDRLERRFNGLNDRVTLVSSEVGYVRRDLTDVINELKVLSRAISERGKINWQPIGITVGAMFPVVSMVAIIIIVYVASIVNPLANNTAAFGKQASDIEDQLHRVQTDFASEVAERKAASAAFKVSLAEIETQFCSMDQKIAIFHSYDLRLEAIALKKSWGIDLPIANAVYPPVGRCGDRS
jgi:hypothetical protein